MVASPTHAEYLLRLSVKQVAGMIGIVVVMIIACCFVALTNQKAVSLFGLVELSPEKACMMFWLFTGFFGLGCLPLALATAWKGRFAGQRVAFTDEAVWLPRSVWSSHHVLVPFSGVLGIRVLTRRRERLLEIELADRKFWVGESWLSSPSAFDEIFARFQAGLATV